MEGRIWLSKNFRDTVDPIIEINCLEKKKFTTSKKDIGPTGIVHWGEHIFFEPKKLVKNEMLKDLGRNWSRGGKTDDKNFK